MEVVSRAALAFASAIREVAYTIDPSIDGLRIELISGTASSLSLNTWLRAKIKDTYGQLTLKAIVLGIGAWLTHQTVDFAYHELLTAMVHHEHAAEVSPDQIEAIVRKTLDAYQKQAAPQTERLFRELETDPAISGVGFSQQPAVRPAYIIPRREFEARSRARELAELGEDAVRVRRTRITIETLTLVSPVLLPGKRVWRFLGREGEFGAYIKDAQFLDNVLRGRSGIPLVAGIRMDVELQTIEDPIEGGAWKVRERDVLSVRSVSPPSIQLGLGISPRP